MGRPRGRRTRGVRDVGRRISAVRAATAVGFGALFASCGGGSPPPPTPTPADPPAVPTSLVVTPGDVVVAARGVTRLSASLLDQLGQPFDAPVLWGSSDPLVVEVDDTGSVVGVREGRALVWARAAALLETVPVTVVPRLTVEVGHRLLPPDSVAARGAGNACVYRLRAVVSGGAPGDSATWAPSAIESLDAAGEPVSQELDVTAMLDRFGTLVLRDGDVLESSPLRLSRSTTSGIVNRVRYTSGAETFSVRVPVACPASDASGGAGR